MQTHTVGLALMVKANDGDPAGVVEAYNQYRKAVFPFIEPAQGGKDAEMKKIMEKEVAKGMLTFKPLPDLLVKKAEAMTVPDEWAKAMRARVKKGALR